MVYSGERSSQSRVDSITWVKRRAKLFCIERRKPLKIDRPGEIMWGD
jgi:hypothetical protein